ncbi:histidine phosphatase family protein [Enterococcus pseudoavium]|uniref:Histidine phosphatase family protein n=1 Tax=Enterococcus pseudoavium TaxID=44007 RepID=A0AAE4I2M4_9ENTE|nr:histidine phosphatase family protein [Enterococcus pseudoavium]MDT2737398.1 histidine phosphatase family protein [Enterococcus pseudoavium]MDT2754005.1 histidine phosphatase family protein [Enterococcus pseudoavium]MDT2771218.1 histidine phosphatase family protein [Enterococcus pseudoavium]REC33347.1 histidine phosphatase family protein [Enterococcus pseudoavium]
MLYVARHGETEWNQKGIISGRSDIALSEKGYEQAALLAEEVANLSTPITQIIHSPLERARETARIVADKNQLSLNMDERLLELDYGDYDGTSDQQEGYLKTRTQFAVRYPHGESLMDVYARVVPLLTELEQDSENIYLLVCHNSVIRAIKNYFEPLENEKVFDYRTPNAKLIGFDWKKIVSISKSA